MAAFVPRAVSKKQAGTPAGAAAKAAAAKRLAQMNKLKELTMQRNEARKMNHQEIVDEDRRLKLPKNFEAKRARTEWEDEDAEKRKEAEEKGENYDRVKLLEVGADEAERWERKKKHRDPDTGFADFEAATFRQYRRLTKTMKPDLESYGREKDKMGEAFYPDQDTLGVKEHKDSEDAIDSMVTDLEKQIDKRAKYSRRRVHDEDDDINYINERNKAFNHKLERFYGKYTTEIKQNLERGTAV